MYGLKKSQVKYNCSFPVYLKWFIRKAIKQYTFIIFWVPLFACDIPVKWVLIIAHTDSYLKFQRRAKLHRWFAAGLIFKFTNDGAGSKRTGRGVFLRERPRRVQRPASESRSVKWRRCTPVCNVPILPARHYVFPLRWNLFDLFRFKSIIDSI